MTTNQIEEINPELFHLWRTDPVTQYIFKQLKLLREEVEYGLKDEQIILSDNGQLKLARLLGQRDGIDTLLKIQYDEDGVFDETANSSST